MKTARRDFLVRSAAAALLSAGAISLPRYGSAKPRPEGDIQLCLSYFYGFQQQKMELSKQMGVLGAVTSANPAMAGLPNEKPWELAGLKAIQDRFAREGLRWLAVEGPTPLDRVKLGLDGKDEEIEHFIIFMENIARMGIDTVCYNWMPVINWARTTTDRPGRGGALVTAFDADNIKDPGPTQYGEFTAEQMWKNLEYFLKAVVPAAEKYGIKLALHPDDPPVDSLRGIARIMTSFEAFKRLLELYPSPSNGITLCQGTFATMGEHIPSVIEYFGKRDKIFFVHFRDVTGDRHHFEESFHDNGKTDMYEAMQWYYRVGFKGPMRPDHVPTLSGEDNRNPGYGILGNLFAIGYMRGLMEGAIRST